MARMNSRLSLCLAAIVMIVVASYTEADLNKLMNMKRRLAERSQPRPGVSSSSATTSAFSSNSGRGGSSAQAMAQANVGGAREGRYASRYGSSGAGYRPAVRHTYSEPSPFHGVGSSAASAQAQAQAGPRGFAGGSAAAHSAGYAHEDHENAPYYDEEPRHVSHNHEHSFRRPPMPAQPPLPSYPSYPHRASKFGGASLASSAAEASGAGGASGASSAVANVAGGSAAAAAAGASRYGNHHGNHGQYGSHDRYGKHNNNFGPRANHAKYGKHGGHNGGYAAASANAMSSPAGYNAYGSEHEHVGDHYFEPETTTEYAAQSGAFAKDDSGRLVSSYVRSTDNEESHEDGKEDGDHYYNAGSFAKSYDEKHREVKDDENEDILQKPGVFMKSKRKVYHNLDKSKQARETGSSVKAQDRFSAEYNKDNRRFRENVDQHYNKEGAGVFEASHSSEAKNFEEEDEKMRDSRHFGANGFAHGGFGHGPAARSGSATAASASASDAGVSSSAAGAHGSGR